MAYFDSSKNRALWEIRLGQLRKERAARESGIAGDGLDARTEEAKMAGAVRIPVSYQELLRREAAETGKRQEQKARARTKDHARTWERTAERQAQI